MVKPLKRIRRNIRLHSEGTTTLILGAVLIVAFCIFLIVKAFNKMKRKKEEAPAPAADPEPSAEEKLLTEIRDLIKEK